MIQICFPVFCGIFQKLVDMALSISPYLCTASGQLRRNLYLFLFLQKIRQYRWKGNKYG